MDTMLFFCDIRGTITGTDNYELLKEKIHRVSQLYACEKIIFSFVSTENLETVYKYSKKMSENSENIIFGRQFYEFGYIDFEKKIAIDSESDKSKLGQMIKYCKELSKCYNLNLICYADDNAYGPFADILKKISKDAEIKILIPKRDLKDASVVSTSTPEIEGLYECLDKIIMEKELEKNCNIRYNKHA